MPENLALHGNILYVLNVATQNANGTTGNIYGWQVSSSGTLTPLGSSQPLANAAPPDRSGDPRAMDFDPTGRVIVVTELAGGFNKGGPPGRINTFLIGSDGKAGAATAYPSRCLSRARPRAMRKALAIAGSCATSPDKRRRKTVFAS